MKGVGTDRGIDVVPGAPAAEVVVVLHMEGGLECGSKQDRAGKPGQAGLGDSLDKRPRILHRAGNPDFTIGFRDLHPGAHVKLLTRKSLFNRGTIVPVVIVFTGGMIEPVVTLQG